MPLSVSFTVANDHPSIPGHFPHKPVVPGVVLLELLVSAIKKELPGQPVLAGFPMLKFPHIVNPGETVNVDFQPGKHGHIHFDAYTQNGKVVSGIAVFQNIVAPL